MFFLSFFASKSGVGKSSSDRSQDFFKAARHELDPKKVPESLCIKFHSHIHITPKMPLIQNYNFWYICYRHLSNA
jgi:hypothetical protein